MFLEAMAGVLAFFVLFWRLGAGFELWAMLCAAALFWIGAREWRTLVAGPAVAAVLAWSAAAILVALYFYAVRGDGYAFVKVYATFFPILLVALAAFLTANLWSPAGRPNVVLRTGDVLSRLLVLSVFLLVAASAGQYIVGRLIGPRPSYLIKTLNYDFGELTARLDALKPKRLLVYAPGDWRRAAIAGLAFERFGPVYQWGYIYDNTDRERPLRPAALQAAEVPDYAVVAADADYIGPADLGTVLQEAGGLRLYRITAKTVTPFLYP